MRIKVVLGKGIKVRIVTIKVFAPKVFIKDFNEQMQIRNFFFKGFK